MSHSKTPLAISHPLARWADLLSESETSLGRGEEPQMRTIVLTSSGIDGLLTRLGAVLEDCEHLRTPGDAELLYSMRLSLWGTLKALRDQYGSISAARVMLDAHATGPDTDPPTASILTFPTGDRAA